MVPGIMQGTAALLNPLTAAIDFLTPQRRVRGNVRDNLALLQELEKDDALRETEAPAWLREQIVRDVARLSRQVQEAPKKPIEWGSLLAYIVFVAGFGFWTYWLNRNAYDWHSVLTGTVALLFMFAVLGSVTSREVPEKPEVPKPADDPASDDSGSTEDVAAEVG
jgi:hypothetical protein